MVGDAGCGRSSLPRRPIYDAVLDTSYDWRFLRVRFGLDIVAGMTADLTGAIPIPPRAISPAGVQITLPTPRHLRHAKHQQCSTQGQTVTA
ncbi:hypothetical protein [Pajaroellobacter abortibovis]|uniref:hypothetical protein n=1 Tax=Pajaroellobacter abortibovis TaxID=1882918 RepID=UPI0012EB1D78|nr:hypothetical protein [Pajaroellobacter abortibovis]